MELSNIVDGWRNHNVNLVITITTRFDKTTTGKIAFKDFIAPPHIPWAENPTIVVNKEEFALNQIKTIEFNNCCYTII